MKYLSVVLIWVVLLSGCGGDDYSEDNAYEDGYEGGELKSSKYEDAYLDGQEDAHCDWLKCSIERGDRSRSSWNTSGCGSWDSYYSC